MGHLRKFVQSFPDGKNSSLILRGLLEVGMAALQYLRCRQKFSACLLIDRFNPLGAPRPRLEGVTEILRLAKDLSIPELHDTDSAGWLPIITDDIFGNPKIAAPDHAPNGEVLVGKQPLASSGSASRPRMRSPD